MLGGPGRPGLGLNRSQEISTVWAPGPWHSRSSFLIPGPVGVAGPWRSTAAATADLLTVWWEQGPPAKHPPTPQPTPGSGPTEPVDPRVLAPDTSGCHMGKLRPSGGGGRTTGCRAPGWEAGGTGLGLQIQGSLLSPPGGAHPPPKAHLVAPPQGCGSGARLCGYPGRRGLFDQRFCLMPGCRDSGQWPNRPHRMPSGPQQECHSSSLLTRLVTAGGGRASGEKQQGLVASQGPLSSQGPWSAFPHLERARSAPGGHWSQNPADTTGQTRGDPGDRPLLGSEGEGGTEGVRRAQGLLAAGHPPSGFRFS